MGSSPSRPAFPMPRPYDQSLSSKSGKWTFSMKKLGKKGKVHEKYDDFSYPKHPVPTPGMYTFPYYPQVQTGVPAYYAPVQMAIVQPIGAQQPVLAMPPTYMPITTYPTAAAPIQPAVVPATQMPAPSVQVQPARMPPSVAPIPVPPPTAPTQMPEPHLASVRSQMPWPHQPPASVQSQVPQPHDPPSVRTQMPQPNPPASQGSMRPTTPVIPNPVIPPPPFANSEPPRAPPDSGRLRLTDFYRTADLPSAPPRSTIDDPVRLPTAMPGPPGRTPFVPPLQMPTPGPISNNPLPAPPLNVWDTSPYRQVLENLPNELPPLTDLPHSDMFFDEPGPVGRSSSRFASLFGSKDKGKKPLRGLFRSRSTSAHDMPMPNEGSSSRHARHHTMTSVFVPPGDGAPPLVMPSPTHTHTSSHAHAPTTSMPVSTFGPPIRFDHTGDYAGFVNHSPHRVMYKNKMYPTALHLLEAMKFVHQPSLQEQIRTCKDVNDMYPLSASFQDQVRTDWGHVFLKIMEDVLYLKFKQHPGLRTLLLRTGFADIIYADENTYWGEGLAGDGTNELGKALVRVRERLRQEGEA